MLEKLIRIRTHIDALEMEAMEKDPEKLKAYTDELLGMRDELRAICRQEMTDFDELVEEHKGEFGQEDLNAMEETLEAVEETAAILAAIGREKGTSGATETATMDRIMEECIELLDEADALPGHEAAQ